MNNRTEEKLKSIDGMRKAMTEILAQAWERGRKYGRLEALEERPQGNLADEVWKLYEKYHSHLATQVLEFGDELKELLGKYQKIEEETT